MELKALKKSLKNFCKNCPIKFKYNLEKNENFVEIFYNNLNFKVSKKLDNKELIKEIKNNLYEFYPTIQENVNIFEEDNVLFDVLELGTDIPKKTYKIEQIIKQSDIIILNDGSTKYFYKSKLPLYIVLPKVKALKGQNVLKKFFSLIEAV